MAKDTAKEAMAKAKDKAKDMMARAKESMAKAKI